MSIRLVSWNVNGIRAVSKKDEFWDWFDNTDADIINFQEVRASQDKIPKKLADVDGFSSYFNEAEKKGYSGVGTYTKIEPVNVTEGLGIDVKSMLNGFLGGTLGANVANKNNNASNDETNVDDWINEDV